MTRQAAWLRPPRPTARLRLTLLYGSLLTVAGAALLGFTYLMWEVAVFRAGRGFFERGGSVFGLAGRGQDVGAGNALDDLPLGCSRSVPGDGRPGEGRRCAGAASSEEPAQWISRRANGLNSIVCSSERSRIWAASWMARSNSPSSPSSPAARANRARVSPRRLRPKRRPTGRPVSAPPAIPAGHWRPRQVAWRGAVRSRASLSRCSLCSARSAVRSAAARMRSTEPVFPGVPVPDGRPAPAGDPRSRRPPGTCRRPPFPTAARHLQATPVPDGRPAPAGDPRSRRPPGTCRRLPFPTAARHLQATPFPTAARHLQATPWPQPAQHLPVAAQ
jgi:hypothetical protein